MMRRFTSRAAGRRWRSTWFPRACLSLGAVTSIAACSLATNVDAFDDSVCPAATKACNDSCVSVTEPSVGCSLPGCTPCDATNGAAFCLSSGTCAVSCSRPNQDCNAQASDGCEVDIDHDPSNCGDCGCRCGSGDETSCPPGQVVKPIANGTPGCRAGLCVAGTCVPGWGDCDGDASNGCETPTNTAANCGTCGTACEASECVCTLQDGSTGCSCVSN